MKFKIYKFTKTTSTNDVAINIIKNKGTYGCVYSESQTKGRGTHGKKWISIKGNLFSSLFFPLEEKLPTFDEFSLINPVIISNVIKKFCNSKKINLKFPNDIFVNKKKICGILQEVVTSQRKNFLVIGIGLNVISNPKIRNSYSATNLLHETNKKHKVKKIIYEIIASYEKFFKEINSYDFNKFKKEVESMSFS